MTRKMQILTQDGQYETESDLFPRQLAELIHHESGIHTIVGYAGSFPSWMTIKKWRAIRAAVKTDSEAYDLAWGNSESALRHLWEECI